MSTNIGPRIGIDGYNTYKAEMKAIIAQIEQYKAQCDALSNSEADLKTKQELLSKQIQLQTDLMMKQSEWNAKVRQAVDAKATITEKDTAVLTENDTVLVKQQTELNKLSAEYTKTTDQVDNFNDEMEETGQNADESSQRISSVSIALGQLMARAVEKGAQLVKQAAEIGINYNATMETYNAAFTTLLGNADKAESAMRKIVNLSKEAPTFSTDSLAKASQMIIATGKDAETATEDVRALANAVAASGGGNSELERMAQNLQQIANAGKATSIDIRQFAYAGIDVYSLLADYMGKTTEEIDGMTVTYDRLTGALRYAGEEGGRYFGGLQNQANTYNGQISALKKNVTEGLGTAFSGLSETLTNTVLPKINEFVSNEENIGRMKDLIEEFTTFLVSFGAANKFSTFLKDNATATKLLAGEITAAQAATELWSSALSLLPAVAVAGGISLLKGAIEDFNKSVETQKNTLIGENATLEDVQQNLANVRAEYENFKNQHVGQTSAFMGGDLIADQRKAYQEAIAELEQMETRFLEEAAQAEAQAADQSGRLNAIIENAQYSFDELKAAYDEYYASAMKAIVKEFDLFEEVASFEDLETTKKLGENLQTQIDFWNNYTNNLALVTSSQAQLSSELLAFLSDGSYESAGYLQAIVNDIMAAGGTTSEEGQRIVDDLNIKFAELQEAQSGYATESATVLSDARNTMNAIVEDATEKMKELNLSDEMYNDGAKNLYSMSEGMRAQIPALNLLGYNIGVQLRNSVQEGVNVAPVSLPAVSGNVTTGTTGRIPSHAKGLDYVPRDNYIAALHKGEMVLTAAQANTVRNGTYQQNIMNRNFNGGSTTINVYAKEGQSAKEIAEDVAEILQNKVSRKEREFG